VSPLRELHKLPFGQLNAQPPRLDRVLRNPRAVLAELLQLDRDGRPIGRPLGQKIALEDHLLAGVLAHVDRLGDADLAADVLGCVLVHDDFQRPLARRVREPLQPNECRGRDRPALGQAVGSFLEAGVGQQVLRRQHDRIVVGRLEAVVFRVKVNVERSHLADRRPRDPCKTGLTASVLGVQHGPICEGHLMATAFAAPLDHADRPGIELAADACSLQEQREVDRRLDRSRSLVPIGSRPGDRRAKRPRRIPPLGVPVTGHDAGEGHEKTESDYCQVEPHPFAPPFLDADPRTFSPPSARRERGRGRGFSDKFSACRHVN
jgi:hypothetical protein